MKIGVIGCGSIGLRHLRNLKALGVGELIAYDPSGEARQKAAAEVGITAIEQLEQMWWDGTDAVFIASPTSQHITHALEAVHANCHVFIEKPLSHDSGQLADLLGKIESQRLISLVGCNMRFHPGPQAVKQLLDGGAVGRVCSARVYTGSYLPDWRPWQDYRRSYSANSGMGGGCILDCIHEVDLTRWYLGEINEVMCMADHVSSLEMDVEDLAALLCRHQSGAISEIHLDYLRRPSGRGCEIHGEEGSIIWRMEERKVRHFRVGDSQWREQDEPAEEWDLNQMYVDEARHFLDCVESGSETICPIREAIQVMRVALSARKSAIARTAIRTNDVFH